MLVLTRKPGERIVIGSRTTLELVGVDAAHRATLLVESPEALRLRSDDLGLDLQIPSPPAGESAQASFSLSVNERAELGGVRLMVVAVKGDQVRLGLEAPPEVEIFREEVYLEIQRENIRAAQARGKLTPADVQQAMRELDTGKKEQRPLLVERAGMLLQPLLCRSQKSSRMLQRFRQFGR